MQLIYPSFFSFFPFFDLYFLSVHDRYSSYSSVMSMPTGSSHISIFVGSLSVVAGIVAFYKSESVPSLLGGTGTGSLLLVSAYMMNTGKEYAGHLLASASSLILAGIGITRYMKLKKMYPTGVMAIVGSLSLAYNMMKTLAWKP